jgi:hypothetical protein
MYLMACLYILPNVVHQYNFLTTAEDQNMNSEFINMFINRCMNMGAIFTTKTAFNVSPS